MKKVDAFILATIFLFALSLFQVIHRIGEEQIKIWDESSSARNAVEMMHSENYMIATINGEPDYHDVKPPFQLWLKVLSFKMFGINEFAVRFPTLVSFFLLLLLMFFFSKSFIKSNTMALLTVILPSVSIGFMFYHIAWHGDTDVLLVLITTTYILLAFLFTEYYPRYKWTLSLLISLFVFLGYFTKSIAGIAPAIGVVLYVIAFKRSLFLKVHSYIPVLVFFLFLFGYYFIVEQFVAPGYLESIMKQHLKPFVSYPTAPKHPEFSFYFYYLLKVGLYPYLYIVPFSIIPLIFSKNKLRKRFISYMLFTSIAFLIGQSSAVMKNEWYIAPIYPLFWMLIAVSIAEIRVIILQYLKKQKILQYVFNVAFVLFLFMFFKYGYSKSYLNNQIRMEKDIYVYEQDGDFLRKIMIWRPHIDHIVILKKPNDYSDRQIDFYIKKYRYFKEKDIHVEREIGKHLINTNVICSKEPLINEIKEKYNTQTLYKGRHSSLLYIYGEKTELFPNIIQGVSKELIDQLVSDIKSDGYEYWKTRKEAEKIGNHENIQLVLKSIEEIQTNDSLSALNKEMIEQYFDKIMDVKAQKDN